MPGLKGRFVCVWNCLIFFVGEYSSVWPKYCRVLYRIQWRFLCLTWNLSRFVPNLVLILTCNFRKKLVWENFSEIFAQTIAILYQNLWNFALLYEIFILRPYCVEKIHTSTFICCLHQVRRYVHKRITKSIYGEEKLGRFIFWKPVLFTVGLGLTMPYSLGVLVWNFYRTFVTVSTKFWLRF